MAKTLRKPLPEDVEFMHASRDEMQTLRKALYPLTRKLAARLARKRVTGARARSTSATPCATRCLRRRAGRAEVQVPRARPSPS
jgi:hypothetical protein